MFRALGSLLTSAAAITLKLAASAVMVVAHAVRGALYGPPQAVPITADQADEEALAAAQMDEAEALELERRAAHKRRMLDAKRARDDAMAPDDGMIHGDRSRHDEDREEFTRALWAIHEAGLAECRALATMH